MGAANVAKRLKPGTLLITPADREDVVDAVTTWAEAPGHPLAGLILSDDIKPSAATSRRLKNLSCPVMVACQDSYSVASAVHDITVKTGPDDTQKIGLIQKIIAEHVNLDRILSKL